MVSAFRDRCSFLGYPTFCSQSRTAEPLGSRARSLSFLWRLVGIGGKVAFGDLLAYSARKFALAAYGDDLRVKCAEPNVFVLLCVQDSCARGGPAVLVMRSSTGQADKEYAWFTISDFSARRLSQYYAVRTRAACGFKAFSPISVNLASAFFSSSSVCCSNDAASERPKWRAKAANDPYVAIS